MEVLARTPVVAVMPLLPLSRSVCICDTTPSPTHRNPNDYVAVDSEGSRHHVAILYFMRPWKSFIRYSYLSVWLAYLV